MQHFNLIILGGGAGAFAAAIKANELQANTLMVNAGLPLGGTCVNVGCVPSKTLLWAGEVMHQSQNHGIPGVDTQLKHFNFQDVIQDEMNLVEMLRKEKYEKVLAHLKHVTFKEGWAQFVSPTEIEVEGERFSADKFIIAAGSTATAPPIPGLKETGYLTHVEALQLKKQPKELVIIGGGPTGLEFAQMYSRFGTKVTLLERGDSLFSHSEKELTDRLQEILQEEGIAVHTGAAVQEVMKEGQKKKLVFEAAGKKQELLAEEILVAAGKVPNTEKLALEKAGVKTDGRKAMVVNEHFQTSQPDIYAVGDVTNLPLRLETTAGREGTLAAENALKGTEHSIDYNTVPYTIFTDPQLAGVGFTEDEQLKQMGVCACRTVSFKDVPKAQIMRRTEGLIKMAIHPETRQILGVHILAPNAGDLVAEAMVLVKNKNTIDDIVSSLPMFPTLSEAIKIAALSFTKDISKLSCCV